MEQEQDNQYLRSKKRFRNPGNWKRNVTKKLKASGECYVHHASMNIQPPKRRKDEACRHNCQRKLTEENKEFTFRRFYEMQDHIKQNIYLQGCLGNNGQLCWKIRVPDGIVYVCQKFFLGLHGIHYSRIRAKVIKPLIPIQDGRGKHGHQKTINADVLTATRTYINNLPARSSHYSQARNSNRKYLESNVSVSSLYEKLTKDENSGVTSNTLKLWQFRKIFNHEFNISIGYPRSDICENCEVLESQLVQAKITGNVEDIENCQQNQQRHWQESEGFYQKMSKNRPEFEDPTHGFYCFDYQKNLQFPMTNIGKEFFLRQCWVYNFGIYDIKNKRSYMFVYTENFAKKGSSETISFLKHFFENILPPEVVNLHLFSDNSFGQNKNRFLLAYIQSLCCTHFESVEVHFPLPGHSRMQVDATFAAIEKKKRREDKIHFPSEWINLIRSSRHTNPFDILYVNYPVTDNLENDGTPIVTVRDYKTNLERIVNPSRGINKLRRLRYQRGRFHPLVSKNILEEPAEEYQVLKDVVDAELLLANIASAPVAYDGYLPISRQKYDNVMYLLSKFHNPPEKTFYTSIFSLPTPPTLIDPRRVFEDNSTRIINEVMNEYSEPFDIGFLD